MEAEEIIEKMDENEISSILETWDQIRIKRMELVNQEEMLKIKIKTHLKERQWDKFIDNKTKISISISMQKRETIDKKQVQLFLTDSQYAQVLKISTFEKMSIITPKDRDRLKNYVKSKTI